MPVYLGKGVLRYAKKEIGYGDEIPEGIDKNVLGKMIKKGLIGEMPIKIKPGEQLKNAMDENARLSGLVEALEIEKKVLLERVDVLEKDAGDLEALEKEVAALTKKLAKAGK